MVRTMVGYAGGTTPGPTYHSLGDHSESVRIEYDPAVTSYERLLEVFWESHDPTAQPWSRQYMAAVFYHDREQKKMAEESKARLEKRLGRKVRTEILPAGPFHRAEDYHQKYYLRGSRGLMSEFRAFYPDEAGFVASTAAARVNGMLGGNGPRELSKAQQRDYGLK